LASYLITFPYPEIAASINIHWGGRNETVEAFGSNGHKTKDSIRRELQTECILDKIDEYRKNWLLQLQRMPQRRIPLKSYHYSPHGKRTVGRPNKRWREQL
jgi:hypothetical protein